MEEDERKDVYKVYDKIATWFFENRYTGLLEKSYLDELIERIPTGGSVLDLGCGTGVPILQYLLDQKLKVTGVDASTAMLKIAQQNFPETEFVLQDMRSLQLNKKFDAVIAWHSFFHLPEADQPAMFETFEKHLNPDGILLFTAGPQRGEAWGMNGGENLFHSSLNTEEYHDLLAKHYFTVIKHIVEDPKCGGATVWMAQYQPDMD